MEERRTDRVFIAPTLCRRWRQCAAARLMRGKLKPWEKEPLLLIFLDGLAGHMFEDLGVENDLTKHGGEAAIFHDIEPEVSGDRGW